MSRFLSTVLAMSMLLIFALPFSAGAQEPSRRSSPPAKGAPAPGKDQRAAESEWIRATGEYKRSLEKMLILYQREFQEQADRVVRQREFYEKNLIARSELEEGRRALSGLETKVREVEYKIHEAGFALGAAKGPKGLGSASTADEDFAGARALIHYDGRAPWSPAGMEKIEKFFQDRFGRYLPVSASGQTVIHDRMHLDHRNAVDVAVHPDSPEGQVLMTYLRGEGISFVAFRSPVAGSATGAHIHIGRPSVRLSVVALEK